LTNGYLYEATLPDNGGATGKMIGLGEGIGKHGLPYCLVKNDEKIQPQLN
jgi:hypothetical protein